MTLTHKSVKALLEDFRSPAPTPGGGSASALAGAVGASLLAMVAGLPKPRASADADLQGLREAGERCTALAIELEALVDRDSEAYERVVSAYRLPKETDEEKALRPRRIQEALVAAIAAPLDVMRACSAGIALGPVLQAHGNANASSDVQVGLELLRAGLRGARLNVEINLGSVKDPAYVAEVTGEIGGLSESGATGVPSASS
jgi:formiminotetrahydrofolate cyclodeaminase